MIRIHRPVEAPAILTHKGGTKRRAHCSAYSRSPRAYTTGAKTFDFRRGNHIYGHESVKKALLAMQHGKCCFCESKIPHIAYGDVEHFRPKAGYRQKLGDPLGRPGYYWLAYEWSNLFLACELCNRRFKECLFPLRDPSQRATSHKHDLSREKPLLIDPTREDPRDHLYFRGELAHPIDGDLMGETTIEVLGLNREKLNEYRRERLSMLKHIWTLTGLSPGSPACQDALDYLRKAVEDSAEYSAMARAAIDSGFSARPDGNATL